MYVDKATEQQNFH